MNLDDQIEVLMGKITPERGAKMRRVVENRTRKIAIVLEDIFQPHNAAAVLRSCDAFGLQQVFTIENRHKLKISHNVDMGSSKWLDIERFVSPRARKFRVNEPREHAMSQASQENIHRALGEVKSRGYKLVAATLREGAGRMDDVPLSSPIALMIGTELSGLSDICHEAADYTFSLPMMGFCQSLNLSVFSAICLNALTSRLRAQGDTWKLSQLERKELLLNWLKKSIPFPEQYLEDAAK